jgi:hypothetical protein
LDHPVFSCYYPITEVTYIENGKEEKGPPTLYGIDLGCRTAVFLTMVDLDCSWVGESDVKYRRIQKDDARKLAINIAAYALGEYRYGKTWAIKNNFTRESKERDVTVIPRILHNGDWDAQAGIQHLLRYAHTNSTMNMSFDQVLLRPSNNEILKYPMVYMSGLSGFNLSDKDVAGLKNYLDHGGVLVADATAGRKDFDKSYKP